MYTNKVLSLLLNFFYLLMKFEAESKDTHKVTK